MAARSAPFLLPFGASGIARGRERALQTWPGVRPPQRARRGRAAWTRRRAGVGARDVGGRPPRAARLLRRGGAGGGRAEGTRFCGSGTAVLLRLQELPLGAVEAASRRLRRDGVSGGAAVPGETRPHLCVPELTGLGQLGAPGLPRESLGLRYLIAPFPSERTALFMRGSRELLESISPPLSQRAIVE